MKTKIVRCAWGNPCERCAHARKGCELRPMRIGENRHIVCTNEQGKIRGIPDLYEADPLYSVIERLYPEECYDPF